MTETIFMFLITILFVIIILLASRLEDAKIKIKILEDDIQHLENTIANGPPNDLYEKWCEQEEQENQHVDYDQLF